MGYEDGSYPGYRDLTPGDFRMGKDVEVSTDSLFSCGESLTEITTQSFAVSMAAPLQFAKSDFGKDAGSRAIGNDPDFDETYLLANSLSSEYGLVAKMEKVGQDLVFGNLALANVAMGMAIKYGVTDGFNAVSIAGAVDDAFAPPSNAQGGTLADKWQEADDKRLDGNRTAHLPVVDPSDVGHYIRGGMTPGEDFVIADTTTPGFSDAPPESDGDFSNGEQVQPPEVEGEEGNSGDSASDPYFEFAEEDDYDLDREQFEPPRNPHAPVTLAPGENYGNGSGSSSTTTV